jgi:hypothetical protein
VNKDWQLACLLAVTLSLVRPTVNRAVLGEDRPLARHVDARDRA